MKIDLRKIKKAYSYQEYYQLLLDLFEQGLTTGEKQGEDMLNYAKLNLQRMKRLNKTAKFSLEFEEFKLKYNEQKRENLNWLVLSEGWCGDAAQSLPILSAIAEELNGVELNIVLRDENLDLMDQFLTNGGRSIPKLIISREEDNEVLNSWGPRPEPANAIMKDHKSRLDFDYQLMNKELQAWYNADKTKSVQAEIIALLKEII